MVIRILSLSIFVIALSALLSHSIMCDEVNDSAWIAGKVIWPGHDLSKASVEVFRDAKFKDIYTRGLLLKPEGMYSLTMSDPGTYYIATVVDDNDNGKFDTGDGMGIYGIMNWADPGQKAVPIKIENGMKLPGVDIQITAVVDIQGHLVPVSAIESGSAGISGKLIWSPPGNSGFSNAILFAYSDPSWNNKVAQVDVKENGEYNISVPPGKYYLLAVIDENKTNLLDAGDKFGIWGITRFDMFPRSVAVSNYQIVRDRNILIIGEMGISGKPLPLHETGSGEVDSTKDRLVLGRIIVPGIVVWPGHTFKSGIVQAYGDPSMTAAVAQAKTGDKGQFRLALPPGDYYIVAGIDLDADGKYSKGDGIGAYGTANAAEQMPGKLTVTEQSKNERIDIVITAEFDEAGQLKPVSEYSMPKIPNVPGLQPDSQRAETGISGKIMWEGHSISRAELIFSDDPEFETGIRIPLQFDDDGSYKCVTPPGDYYIMALVDINDNGQIDSGDGMGRYGTNYLGGPQKVTVLDGWIAPFININITESFEPDGGTTAIRTPGSIRFWYGEPDELHTDRTVNPAIQKWRYWSRGIIFTFEENEAGWILTDTYEFDPEEAAEYVDLSKKTSNTPQPGASSKGKIFYTYDGSLWKTDVDSTNRKRIAMGNSPTATPDGDKLIFLDADGNTYLAEPGSAKLPLSNSPQILISRHKPVSQPAISHDGKVLAFTRDNDGYKQIILRNLETKEESPIPVGIMDLYDPAWSSDGELIAYSASSDFSPDQPNRNRDIYYYDLVARQVERVSTSSLDEFTPAWAPDDKRALVYCRAEGDHSQLWIVNFDANGKPIERQLTRYGGRNPSWSPDGSRIIYENNVQLWTINPDGSEETPLVVDGEPKFGSDPLWTR